MRTQYTHNISTYNSSLPWKFKNNCMSFSDWAKFKIINNDIFNIKTTGTLLKY